MIEPSPFGKCKECRFYGCGQVNMPCRACCFGSKFEVALLRTTIPKLELKLDISKLLPNQKIIENRDRRSIHPDVMDSLIYSYCAQDVRTTKELGDIINKRVEAKMKIRKTVPEIKDVIFNDPATIVFWDDGTKTVVKSQGDEKYDPEKGLAMAIAKKLYGDNKRDYYITFKKFVGRYEKQKRKHDQHNVCSPNLETNMSAIAEAAKQTEIAISRATENIRTNLNALYNQQK